MTFRSSSILFLLALVSIFLLDLFYSVSLWWILLPLVVYKALIIYGSATICSDFYIKAICRSETNEKHIAITFDDGPDKKYTPEILNVLSEYGVHTTFFVIGKNIKGNEDIIRQLDLSGHTIGNHTFSHSFFIDFKSKSGFMNELNQTSELIYKLTNKNIKWFRPPYGVTTPNLARAAKELKYEIIGWNIRSMDTTSDSEEIIMKRIKKQMKPGSVILFHDTSAKTVNVLKQTLNFAKENGFKIVSAEELFGISSKFES
jgi:peptidoglycan-N-acetylglucosamine deacetylase